VEQNGDQLTCVRIDLVGKVLKASAATKAQYGGAVAAWDYCTAKAWCASLLEFFALCTLRLAGL
jgi:hypothetical protein